MLLIAMQPANSAVKSSALHQSNRFNIFMASLKSPTHDQCVKETPVGWEEMSQMKLRDKGKEGKKLEGIVCH